MNFLFNKDKQQLVRICYTNCPYSEKPCTVKIDASMTLDKVRLECKAAIKDDMYFCANEGLNVIPQCQENRIRLHEILDNGKKLSIERSENYKEIMPRFIKEEKLDCGIRMTEDGLEQSDNVAFKFND